MDLLLRDIPLLAAAPMSCCTTRPFPMAMLRPRHCALVVEVMSPGPVATGQTGKPAGHDPAPAPIDLARPKSAQPTWPPVRISARSARMAESAYGRSTVKSGRILCCIVERSLLTRSFPWFVINIYSAMHKKGSIFIAKSWPVGLTEDSKVSLQLRPQQR